MSPLKRIATPNKVSNVGDVARRLATGCLTRLFADSFLIGASAGRVGCVASVEQGCSKVALPPVFAGAVLPDIAELPLLSQLSVGLPNELSDWNDWSSTFVDGDLRFDEE
mmetsp:Transcript_152371/g.486869  ORF Transcript_152371/g.486869 Transcript_152371/m.486869 type:complete len:110 (+) Transcript_152371:1650-1979(+)